MKSPDPAFDSCCSPFFLFFSVFLLPFSFFPSFCFSSLFFLFFSVVIRRKRQGKKGRVSCLQCLLDTLGGTFLIVEGSELSSIWPETKQKTTISRKYITFNRHLYHLNYCQGDSLAEEKKTKKRNKLIH